MTLTQKLFTHVNAKPRGSAPNSALAAWLEVGVKKQPPLLATEHRRSVGVKGFRGKNGRPSTARALPIYSTSLDPAYASGVARLRG